MRICVLDFETYYDPLFSLSKITTEEYVRSPLFETIGLAYKFDDGEVVWVPQPEVEAFLKSEDWSSTMIVAQNVQFDGAILAWRYGVKPLAWADTLGMSRALYPHEKQHGLKYQATREGIGIKGTEVENAIGKRYADFTPEQLARYAEYCCQDVFLTHRLFSMYVQRGFPVQEMRLIDLTTRMFTEPLLQLDREGLVNHLQRVREGKARLLEVVRDKILEGADPDQIQTLFSEGTDGIKKMLMSNDKFAELLRMMGIAPPTKLNSKGKTAWAFAKTDDEFKALEEHPNPMVQALVAARLGNKTTLEETRTERFIGTAGRGTFPVPLRYYGAATGRWCLTGDHEVLTPTGWVRLDSWAGQPIRQWDPETKALTWCAAPTMSSFPVSEPLVCFGGAYHKARYTREHRIPVKKRHLPNTPKDILAKDLAARAKKDLYVSGYITAEGAPPTPEEIAQLQLTVAMHADGYNVADSKNNMVRFRFTKRRKLERLEAILHTLQLPYTVSTHPSEPSVRTLVIPGRHAPEWLRTAKQLPKSWYTLDAARAEIVLRELVEWDGCRSGPSSVEWCGTDRDAATLFATLAHLTGRRAKWAQRDRAKRGWATTYRLSIVHAETVTEYGTNATEQMYVGLVFCPTVNTGYFLCRGSDTIFITGNSGQDSVNLQNLPSRGKNAKSIKKCIVAPPGYVVIDCDSSQIEARCLAWEAGQEDLLQAFRDKGDVYSQMASKIYGRPVNRKRVEVDPVTGKEFKPDQREGEVGKATILGAGYGMGGNKFQTYLKIMGIEMEESECGRVITTYRDSVPKIAELWGRAGEALDAMISGQSHIIDLNGNRILKVVEGNRITLPSGLWIQYPELRKEYVDGKYEYRYTSKGLPVRIYGPKVVENFTQAVARCVVAEQMLRIAKRYKVSMTVHDSVVALARAEEKDEAMAYITQCMSWVPPWAEGLPLDCEAGAAASYGEC